MNVALSPEEMDLLRDIAEDRDVPVATAAYTIIKRVITNPEVREQVFAMRLRHDRVLGSVAAASTTTAVQADEDEEEPERGWG